MDQRIVIFGGPDRCGKTTIAKELSGLTKWPYFKPVSQQRIAIENPDAFKMQTRWGEPKLFDFLKQTGHSAIIDRGFPCDWVYSKALGRQTAWGTIDELDWYYSTLNAFLVFTVRKSYLGRQDDNFKSITEERLYKLHDLYVQYARRTSIPCLVLETDDENLQEQVRTILTFIGSNLK